ncbi:hypothetical protein Tsp_08858 [Trichinella spiralis]|uniref:hypothetical protein n=1 Tax=Trichinella spiralis TaxID=6334 RepID=UPI0001EFE899|nr:hypothetical protein Tsp_08858 [Trichinella spiralis]
MAMAYLNEPCRKGRKCVVDQHRTLCAQAVVDLAIAGSCGWTFLLQLSILTPSFSSLYLCAFLFFRSRTEGRFVKFHDWCRFSFSSTARDVGNIFIWKSLKILKGTTERRIQNLASIDLRQWQVRICIFSIIIQSYQSSHSVGENILYRTNNLFAPLRCQCW